MNSLRNLWTLFFSALILALGINACSPPPPPTAAPAAKVTPPPPAMAPSKPPSVAKITGTDPFPPGFDWPADPAVLQAAINAKNSAALRQHSWYLWAGINTLDESGRPIWWSWPTSTQAYPYQPPPQPVNAVSTSEADSISTKHGMRAKNAANTPINLPSPIYVPPAIVGATCQGQTSANGLADGPRFASNGDILIADVVYDEDAFNWIAQTDLANSNTVTAQWNNGQGDKQIAPFPNTSIVLKHMYWPVRGDDFTALPVWTVGQYPPTYPNYIGYEYWKRVVIIDPRNKKPKPGMRGVTKYLYNVLDATGKLMPSKVGSGQIYPVEAFYNQMIDADLLASMDPRDVAILNASACWLYNRPFQAGDYLVTVATHIISKEIPQWTLQSAWWSDNPNAGPFAADRPNIPPQQAPGPWRNYLLTVEYGVPAAPGLLPISFNPYIELAAGHPIQTNCRNCHMRAAWPRKGGVPSAPVYNSYEATGGPGPLVDLNFTDPVFNQLMTMDLQWAAADRSGAPPDKALAK
jgi:hypothetical protein